MSEDQGWHFSPSHTCWECGRQVKYRIPGHTQTARFHACWLHPIARLKWKSELKGWHSGYRFAVENSTDSMVTADADDYGTGWAGHMRVGYVSMRPDELKGETK